MVGVPCVFFEQRIAVKQLNTWYNFKYELLKTQSIVQLEIETSMNNTVC